MKKSYGLTFAVAVMAVVLTGCQYPNGEQNNTGSGALIGGGIGALSGAVLGGRNAAAGALIGGAIGAVAGSIVGNQMDQQQEQRLQAQAPATYVRVQQGQPLQVADVEALVKANVSDDVIIAQIQNSHTVYHLASSDIIGLHQSGVSDRVVNFMINTASAAEAQSTTVVQTAPPAAPPTTVVVASPGPGYLWVDGDWEWNGGTWVWVGGHWVYPPYGGAVWIHGGWYQGPHGWYHERGYWR
ncbi:MAG TPA: YXWGXW repeat-containing protein [Verrucomicrobiae bacterium]|jgi:outer membrane lipoprotein SlyB